MKRLFLLLALALTLCGQATLVTMADITGDGSAHALSGTVIYARTIDITALAANGAVCRTGDSNVGASRGQVIAAGGSYHYQALPSLSTYSAKSNLYDLSQIYYYCGNGDKLTVLYAK